MTEITMEGLAKRIDALEQKLGDRVSAKKDWRTVVGILAGSETAKQMLAESTAMREADRAAAREGRDT